MRQAHRRNALLDNIWTGAPRIEPQTYEVTAPGYHATFTAEDGRITTAPAHAAAFKGWRVESLISYAKRKNRKVRAI